MDFFNFFLVRVGTQSVRKKYQKTAQPFFIRVNKNLYFFNFLIYFYFIFLNYLRATTHEASAPINIYGTISVRLS